MSKKTFCFLEVTGHSFPFVMPQDMDLIRLQKKAWKPIWKWMDKSQGAPLDIQSSILATNHSEETVERVTQMVHDLDIWQLTAVQVNGTLRLFKVT